MGKVHACFGGYGGPSFNPLMIWGAGDAATTDAETEEVPVADGATVDTANLDQPRTSPASSSKVSCTVLSLSISKNFP